jgi:hypothetical protein
MFYRSVKNKDGKINTGTTKPSQENVSFKELYGYLSFTE